MANLLLNISSPSLLASKTSILPHYKLIHKPLFSRPMRSEKPMSSHGLAITKCYQNVVKERENQVFPNGLQAKSIPKHVAILIENDGDLLPDPSSGATSWSLMDIARTCCELGIKVLTTYNCSSGNNEKIKEVDLTMNLTKSYLEELSRYDIRVSVIGDRSSIPDSLLEIVTQLEEATKNNKSLHIIETINYTGRFDILQSCVALAEKVKDGIQQPEEIDENIFEQELETKGIEFPDPDLIIRTGHESGFGDFMLWQSSYSEFYYVEKDAFYLNKSDFIKALDAFQKRKRRFGGKMKY